MGEERGRVPSWHGYLYRIAGEGEDELEVVGIAHVSACQVTSKPMSDGAWYW